VSPGGRRQLSNKIVRIVHRDTGRTAAELAEMTGATVAEVRSVTWLLCKWHQLDWCAGYYVMPAVRRPARSTQ
jgi:hypothetical protein